MRKHVYFHIYFDDGTIKDHFRTHLLLTFLLSFDLFWIGEISASSVTIHQNLCSEQPKLTQCQAILNFDRLPTNYNCNPDQQNNCQLNDLVSNDIASCRLDIRPEEKGFNQRYFYSCCFYRLYCLKHVLFWTCFKLD